MQPPVRLPPNNFVNFYLNDVQIKYLSLLINSRMNLKFVRHEKKNRDEKIMMNSFLLLNYIR